MTHAAPEDVVQVLQPALHAEAGPLVPEAFPEERSYGVRAAEPADDPMLPSVGKWIVRCLRKDELAARAE